MKPLTLFFGRKRNTTTTVEKYESNYDLIFGDKYRCQRCSKPKSAPPGRCCSECEAIMKKKELENYLSTAWQSITQSQKEIAFELLGKLHLGEDDFNRIRITIINASQDYAVDLTRYLQNRVDKLGEI